MKSKLIILSIISAAALLQLPSAANAQDLESSYFMEGSTYRHRMNPAFINESNYINLPFIGIGNMNINVSSDFGMSNFLYPAANGSLTTFMNPSVSSEQFLSGLNTKNRLGLSLSTDILSVGFYGIAGGYSTIELGIKSDTWLNLPYQVKRAIGGASIDHNVLYILVRLRQHGIERVLYGIRSVINCCYERNFHYFQLSVFAYPL